MTYGLLDFEIYLFKNPHSLGDWTLNNYAFKVSHWFTKNIFFIPRFFIVVVTGSHVLFDFC